jgi:hypothetical protein
VIDVKRKNEKKTIAYLLSISIILLVLGLYTAFASISFASPLNGPVKYDVYFSEVGTNSDVLNRTIVNTNRIDIGLTFNEYGKEYIANTSLNNDSNVDTKLNELKMTNLEEVKVAKSNVTGIEYTLNDFIYYKVYYEFDSQINSIEAPNSIKEGDLLRRNTTNNIIIKVGIKEEHQLTKDQKYVFEHQLNKELDANLFLEAIFLEE